MNVKELREALAAMPDEAEVLVWLPGSTITIGAPFLPGGKNTGKVFLEGNVVEGSAIEEIDLKDAAIALRDGIEIAKGRFAMDKVDTIGIMDYRQIAKMVLKAVGA